MYDFIIIGGGPAGATLARLIEHKYRVLLIEKSGEKAGEKLCGGLIAPDAQRMLGKFGLSLPVEVLVTPQMFYVKAHDLESDNMQKYQRHYLNVNRKAFDNWLLSLLPDSVVVLRNTGYSGHDLNEGRITVKTKGNNGEQSFQTKYLIGADGGQSLVRKFTFGDFKHINKYTSIQSEIENKTNPECFEVFFDKNITDFYGWKIPKNNKMLIGAALKGKHSKQRYELFLKKVLGNTFSEKNRKSCILVRPKSLGDFRTQYKNRIFFIGESAGFISPSSAEGFSYAFKSAELLARAILQKKAIGSAYNRLTFMLKLGIFLKNLKSIVMYNPFLRNLIFKTGIRKL